MDPDPIDPIDGEELERAWRLLRRTSRRLDRLARDAGLPVPFSPLRYLILTTLAGATAYGLSARRLARSLSVRPPTMAYHLEALENAELIRRTPWTVHDKRKVAVRLTDGGRHAIHLLGGSSAG